MQQRFVLPPGWRVHDIAAGLRLRIVRPLPVVSPGLEAEIDLLWAAAQARMGGALFNGRVFSADGITPDLVTGHWTEFRRIVAQMSRPDLFAALGVRGLAVNGVVHGPDGFVFGRRPAGALYQPGEWQLPPAGSVDDRAAAPDGTVDARAAVLAELAEELGLPPEAVGLPRLLALVEHAGSHVLDLGIALPTRLGARQLRAAHRRASHAEYAGVEIVGRADLPGFLARVGNELAPQTLVFLSCMGALPTA